MERAAQCALSRPILSAVRRKAATRHAWRRGYAPAKRERSCDSSEDEGAVTTAVLYEFEEDPRVARMREELACRDEIIVALQHVVRDLQHELENLRMERAYAECAFGPPRLGLPRTAEEAAG